MWETAQRVLSSEHPWSAVFYLIVGAIFGALVSIYLSVRAQRPRLILSGSGGGGNQQQQRWSLSISNRPTFFGVPFAGEIARDVHAHLKLRAKDAASYLIYWSGSQRETRTSIEPGQPQSLEVFSWFAGTRGYCVIDHTGDPIARFEARELKFVLRLSDRLGRVTTFPFTVIFDDTHLKKSPELRIIHPLSLEMRLRLAKRGLRQLFSAFRLRQ